MVVDIDFNDFASCDFNYLVAPDDFCFLFVLSVLLHLPIVLWNLCFKMMMKVF